MNIARVTTRKESGPISFLQGYIDALTNLSPPPLLFILQSSASSDAIEGLEVPDIAFTTFMENRGMPIHPFRGMYDEEKISFLTKFLINGFELSSPFSRVDATHRAAISKAVSTVASRKRMYSGSAVIMGRLLKTPGDREIDLSVREIVEELLILKPSAFHEYSNATIEALLYGLMPFYGNGIYAKQMSPSPEHPTAPSRSTQVYDLRSVGNHPILGVLMAMGVTEEVKRVMKEPENKGRAGFMFYDNAHLLSGGTTTGLQFLNEFVRQSKDLNLSLVGMGP